MEISISLPEDIARHIGNQWKDLPRRTLEALVMIAYQDHVITGTQAQRLLGLESRFELDTFLKQAGVYLEYSKKDLAEDVRTLDELLGS